jgi:hypothetical protein
MSLRSCIDKSKDEIPLLAALDPSSPGSVRLPRIPPEGEGLLAPNTNKLDDAVEAGVACVLAAAPKLKLGAAEVVEVPNAKLGFAASECNKIKRSKPKQQYAAHLWRYWWHQVALHQ